MPFSQHMQGTELNESGERLIISRTRPVRSWLQIRLRLSIGLALASLIAAMMVYFSDHAKIAGLLVALGLFSSLIALVFGLYLVGLKQIWLDRSQQKIGQGRSAWPLTQVWKMTIRRNPVNNRYRNPTVKHLADSELSDIQVIAHLGRVQHLSLGAFKSTEIAQQYATEVAQFIGFDGPHEIDG